jgi:hypothetical protein
MFTAKAENVRKIEATLIRTIKFNGRRAVTLKTVGVYGKDYADCLKKLQNRIYDIEDTTGVCYGIKGEVRIVKTETVEVLDYFSGHASIVNAMLD